MVDGHPTPPCSPCHDVSKVCTPDALIRSMAPVNVVIKSFKYNFDASQNDSLSFEEGQPASASGDDNVARSMLWAGGDGQCIFASLLRSIISPEDLDSENFEGSSSSRSDATLRRKSEAGSSIAPPPAFQPSRRYTRSLILRYISQIESCGMEVEDETLLELLAEHVVARGDVGSGRGMALGGDVPNPNDFCYISFRVPTTSMKLEVGEGRSLIDNQVTDEGAALDRRQDDDILGIRIYPHHNDVSLRLWEAGCCLAEYLLMNPHHVRGEKVLELGSGVGLTGLIAAGCCGADRVQMTDYSTLCLENMAWNVKMNRGWLERCGAGGKVMTSYLEWETFANETERDTHHSINSNSLTHQTPHDNEQVDKNNIQSLPTAVTHSPTTVSDVDILLAADVVYDTSVIPHLVKAVERILEPCSFSSEPQQHGKSKYAIFATTYRNQKTFELFQHELMRRGISCQDVGLRAVNDMPYVFPCYFQQPRSDVRIWVMTV